MGFHVAQSGFRLQDQPEDSVNARRYRELLEANERTVQGVLRLYNTAMVDQCGQYLNALRTNMTRFHELIDPVVTLTAAGRIHPLGFFDNREGMVEYFMLACFGRSAVIRETWQVMTVWNDTVFFDIDFCLQPPPGNLSNPCGNLTHIGFARVDQTGRVRSLKVMFQRLGISDLVLPPLNNPGALATAQAVQNATLRGICQLATAVCTGANQQFADMNACIAYYESIPYGGWERGDQQDLGCVTLHSILTQSRPSVHCPHIGPTGGGKCIAHNTKSFYDTDDIIFHL